MATKKAKKYSSLYYKSKPVIFNLIKGRLFELTFGKIRPSAITVTLPIPDHPYEFFYFAVLIDGVIVDYIRVNGQIANAIARKAEFIEYDPNKVVPEIGEPWDGKQ